VSSIEPVIPLNHTPSFEIEGAWMAPELWAFRTDARPIPDGTSVVLALDGSFSQDCTALVVCMVGDVPHLDVVGLWENPNPAGENYRVDVLDRVLEVTADPFRWQRSLQVLADERLPVSEYPQSPSRMTPACSAFYEAVIDGTVTHSGDKRLARHVSNAVLRTDSRGARIVKESKHSKRRIDLAVAAVMAHSRATELARRPAPSIYVG